MDSLGTIKTLKINNVELTTCSRGLIEKLIGSYLVKKLPVCYEPECPLPCSLVAVVSPTNPVHTFSSYFFKIHFNIILLYTPRCSKRSVSSSFHHQTSTVYQCHVSRSFRSPVCHHANDTWRGD